MPTASENKTTRFEYNLDGNLVKLISENPTTGNQVTEWFYGVTIAQGSALESKSLVHQKKYPDSTGTADRVTYTYNRQGQVTNLTDQAGTMHTYAFDKLGRILEDAATFPSGSILDQTVKKITRSYEVRGMLSKVGSFGTGTTPLNEVLLTYNVYGQLAKDYQEHSGAVNTGSTLNVAYSYADGSANTVRRTGITYPNGTTTITTAYFGTDADALSRPDALKEGSDTLCSYRYLGAGVFIGVKYDAASDVELTYEDGGTGDAGDKYTGLDRFGRLIETLWKKGSAAQVHSQYGRNRFGGIVWRKDLTAHAQSVTTEDNFYQYDGLYQVKEHQRGNLTGTPPSGITNLQQEEDWTYDATGNWDTYTNSDPTRSQDRTNNQANEITEIINPDGTLTPSYDLVGNMLTMPAAPGTTTGEYSLKWDAWNRLVEVKDGETVVASYNYDGLTRRLTTASSTETRHFYYNRHWRAVEELVEGASIAVDRQYTWGLRDRWDLLRRKRSTGGSSLNEVHFCLKDYLDPVAIVGTDGLVKERFAYDVFGDVQFLAPDFSKNLNSNINWEFLFHAEFRDTDTSLYNYGYRYFNANIGRWTNVDPINERGGLNLFGFVANNPLSGYDLFGLQFPYVPPEAFKPGGIYGPKPKPKPNHEKSYNVHGSYHLIIIEFKSDHCFCDCGSIVDDIYKGMKTFSNWGTNSVANISLTGDILSFDPLGFFTTIGNAGALNSVTWPVQLTYDDANHTVIARTLEGHAIVGLRTFAVTGKSRQGKCIVKIHTDGLEKADNLANAFGGASGGRNKQEQIWTEYLNNIATGYSKSKCYVGIVGRTNLQWNTYSTYNPWLGE